MSSRRYRIGFLVVLHAAAAQAAAQAPDASAPLEEIVVTAGRTGDPLRNFGGTTIQRAEIEILQPVSALDLLDRTAGVRAFEKGGTGGASYLSIRGGEPNFTLVLLDGVRVNDPTNSRGGAFDFAQLDPFALDRVEVAKGALSAVHGSDALSGAVNLRLRSLGDEEGLLAGRATADTRGGVGGSATFGAGWNDGDLLISGSAFSDDGDAAGDTDSSDLDRRQLLGRAHQQIFGLGVSALVLRASTDRKSFPEDSGGPRLAVIREREARNTALSLASLDVTRADTGTAWQPRLSLDWMRQDDDVRTPPIAPGKTIEGVPALAADSRFERREIGLENRFFADRAAEFAFGVSSLRESGKSGGTIDVGIPLRADFAIDRTVIGGFAEASLRPADWALTTLAIRYDDSSREEHKWTRRAALRLEPFAGAPALFASWSEGFKLPSLYALAYPIIANPDLRPEQSEGFEIGIEKVWAEEGARVRMTYFRSRYADLIDFDPALFTNVNRSRVTVRGVESEVAAPISPTLDLNANLTWLVAHQPVDALPLRARPEWQAVVSLYWQPEERLKLFFSALHTSDFFDSSVPTGLVTLEDRTTVTAAAMYRVSPALSLTFTARNLLSEDYEEAVGFPVRGLFVRASVVVHIGESTADDALFSSGGAVGGVASSGNP